MYDDRVTKQAHGNRYNPEAVVAVSSAGTGIAWAGGDFHGPEDSLDAIAASILLGRVINFNGCFIAAGDDNPMSALAAMASLRPGRTIVTEAPESVLDELRRHGYLHPFIRDDAS